MEENPATCASTRNGTKIKPLFDLLHLMISVARPQKCQRSTIDVHHQEILDRGHDVVMEGGRAAAEDLVLRALPYPTGAMITDARQYAECRLTHTSELSNSCIVLCKNTEPDANC